MAIIVTGNAYSMVSGVKNGDAQIYVQLCGYGSQAPRINGVALFTELETQLEDVDPLTGEFEAAVWGNDMIIPAGTYYVFTFADGNGDVVQVNAYRFSESTPNYDLNLIDPYDPNQPPPPLPPLITNMLQIVGPADDMVFDGTTYTAFKTTISGSVEHPVFQNMIPGNLYTFIIVQDGTGGRDFAWASNVKNATAIDPSPNATTLQTFIADETESLWAIGPGTWQS